MPDPDTFPILSLDDFRKLTPAEQQAYLTALANHLEDVQRAAHPAPAPARKARKQKKKL